MIHANRQQGSRRTIDLSVRSDPNPRISEWPMPGLICLKPFSGCLQKQKHKICDDFCDLSIDKCHYISVQPAPFVKLHCVLIVAAATVLLIDGRLSSYRCTLAKTCRHVLCFLHTVWLSVTEYSQKLKE